MFTTVAFNKATANVALAAIQPIADQHVTTSGDDLTVPELNRIVAYAVSGSALTQAQLRSPSLRRIFLQDVRKALTTGMLTPPETVFSDLRDDPLTLDVSEKLNVYTIHDAVAGANAVIWLADGPLAPVHGDIRTIAATSAISSAGYEWAHGDLTFAQTLPAGRYQVVGMRAYETGLIAARMVFVGGTWRPGVPGCGGIDVEDLKAFRRGRSGPFGEFEFDQPPSVDILSDRSVTAQTFALDLIQVRAGRS